VDRKRWCDTVRDNCKRTCPIVCLAALFCACYLFLRDMDAGDHRYKEARDWNPDGFCADMPDPPQLSTANLSEGARRCQRMLLHSKTGGERELDQSLAPGVNFNLVPIPAGPTPLWFRHGKERGEAEWVLPPKDRSEGKVRVVFVHGGSFRWYSPRDVYRPLTSRLAAAFELPVLAVDYRLVPEHVYPAGFVDAVMALKWARVNSPPGYPESDDVKLVIVGDSAGGSLALAAALAAVSPPEHFNAFYLPPNAHPHAVVLFSPWIDLAATCPSYCSRASEDIIFGRGAADCGRGDTLKGSDRYLGGRPVGFAFRKEFPPEFASPMYAPDALVRSLPPTLMMVGDAELLVGEVEFFAWRANRLGNSNVRAQAWAGMWHDWVCYAGESCQNGCGWKKDGSPRCEALPLREGEEAIQEAADFIHTNLGLKA